MINHLNTNIVRNMSTYADNSELCLRARNIDDIMELKKDINKLVEWANKW